MNPEESGVNVGENAAEDITAETELAYEEIKAELELTTPSKTKSLNLKVLSTRGRLLYAEVQKPDVSIRIAKLDPDLFNRQSVPRLLVCSRAAAYAYGKHKDAKTLRRSEEVRLPKTLVDKAQNKRGEMIVVLEYVVGADEEVAALLKDIKSGRGYEDLATDLERLGRLYEQHKEALHQDRLKYRKGDAAEARALDDEITGLLDANRRQQIKHWTEQSAKVASLLRDTYSEVVDAARWVMRTSNDLDSRFPSLFAGKGGRKAKSKTEKTPTDAKDREAH